MEKPSSILKTFLLLALAFSASLSYASREIYDESTTTEFARPIRLYQPHYTRSYVRHRRVRYARRRRIPRRSRYAVVRQVYKPVAYRKPREKIAMPVGANVYAGHSCERSATRGNSMMCLACNAWLEAGTQRLEGQIKVDRTVMTRKSLGYASSVCDVIYKPWAYSWTKVTKHKDRHLPYGGPELAAAITAAQTALKLGGGGATHYYANYIPKPDWARSSMCHFSSSYGVHQFYVCSADVQEKEIAAKGLIDPAPYYEPGDNDGKVPFIQHADLEEPAQAGT